MISLWWLILQGEEYGIQFNPDKTTIVVFNLKVKRTVNEMRADVWQGPFILVGKTVEVVNSVKILSQIISNEHNDDEHISKRKKATHAMIGKLQAINLNSLHIHPYMKAHLFKTYINLNLNGIAGVQKVRMQRYKETSKNPKQI